MMAFWTYMLRCSDGRYHTGHAGNLEYRIGQLETNGCGRNGPAHEDMQQG
ncbi:excinuclease ABC subunit C [Sphingobium sp. TKS]|nr:excinuclease ABC subunit C [Sphingobium sp. TKS]